MYANERSAVGGVSYEARNTEHRTQDTRHETRDNCKGFGARGNTTRQGASDSDASPPAGATAVANLQVVELRLERLDRAVGHLEVLVEPVALRDELHEYGTSVHAHQQGHRSAKYARAAPTA